MKRTRNYPLDQEKVLKIGELPAPELRLLVANYYQSQEMRKRMDMQIRHLGDRPQQWSEEIRKLLTFVPTAFADIEEQIKNAFLNLLNSPHAKWCLAQRGIGPVLTAGFLAHIDIHKAKTAGAVWRFAGLDPSREWMGREKANEIVEAVMKEQGVKKPDEETISKVCALTNHNHEFLVRFATTDSEGEPVPLTKSRLAKAVSKRPYNAELKQLTWHAGQCFMKQSNDPDCFYGRLYRKRKAFEIERNEAGGNAERAKVFKVKPDATKAVKDKLASGKLPDFNIDARARRYAVKIFLSHLHFVWHFSEFKRLSPIPHVIAFGGHAHEIYPENCDLIPGLTDAMKEAGRWDEAAE